MRLRNGTVATALAFMASILSLSWYTAWQNGKEKLIAYQREFHALKERLRIAEHRTLQRSSELNTLLRQFKQAVAETNGSKNALSRVSDETLNLLNELRNRKALEVPNIYYLLPHLLRNETSLQPSVQVGLGRTGVSIVMGIPTVKRKVRSYLINTLQSLIYKLSPEEKQDCVMIVFIGETDLHYVNNVVARLEKQFSTEIRSGLVEIIAPSVFYYPDMENLKQTFGDSKERVRWRTKQNLDYCFLMMYAQKKGEYYIQLEDDIVANHNYFSRMKNFARQLPSEDWMILEFSQLGFIGKMFRSADVTLIVEFILMFYKEKPIDWLLDHILWVKACHPEKDAKHCDRQKSSIRIRFRPSLFQHEGVHSSLDGKIQNLKDKYYLKAPLYEVHVNPPAEVSTTLRVYDGHSLEKAYMGEDFFWAITPSANDYILFKFDNPVNIERYFIRTGNANHPEDLLFNTSLEVLPFKNEELRLSQETKEKQLEDGYFRIGKFENGIAEGKVDPGLNPIGAVRLFVMQTSTLWAVISEIHIKKASQLISWKKEEQKKYF